MAFFSISPPSPSLSLLATKRHPFAKPPIPATPQTPDTRARRFLSTAAAPPELGALERDQKRPSSSPEPGVAESVKVLKAAAKTRRVPAAEVLDALAAIKKAKAESSSFLETLGGTESPGRTWMLIFTAQGKLEKGRYFPLTAVQRFDAAAKRIENGVYLGPIGCLTFEGKFSWKDRILAFIFECVRIKVGPFGPLQISLGGGEREPSTKDPFFIWFYVDEEIAVAQGRGGGIAFWCRCRRVT
ncbi:uncharacterized protein LOC103722863 [Phoenix dactylifera]|uniref:Uncharacterized protein LOC103722863 n=1 Tax=Phoenix dactylifera TaxID=42345 RepID=A0A8B7D2L6_PHODC|nr:uncharacterized protein LOC103722863 [Phoenix dactylifera]